MTESNAEEHASQTPNMPASPGHAAAKRSEELDKASPFPQSKKKSLPTPIKNLLLSRSTPKTNEEGTVGVLGHQAVQSLELRAPAIAVRRLS